VNNVAANQADGILVGVRSIVEVESSTIANNEASFKAGGAVSAATLTISNSIFWNNGPSPIFTFPEAPMTSVRFSDIEGGRVGVGNIDDDPMFVDEQTDNYRLRSSSPAIDAGTNAGAPAVDLDGRRRPIDGDGDRMPIVDMGAFEFKPVKAQH
jgi:hypothetical protein